MSARKKPRTTRGAGSPDANILKYKGQYCELVPHPEISKWRTDQLVQLNLMNDIRARGQLQNMVARKLEGCTIELLAGYQRHLALKALGKNAEDMDIKILENVSDEEAILIAFSENNTRTDLTTIEEARVFKSLSKLKLTHAQIAKKTEQSETYVRDRLHLLELPKDVQKLIAQGKVPVSYSMSIRKLDGIPNAQLALAKKICSTQWDAVTTIEKAEEVVEQVLADKKRREKIAAEFGPCPKCGSNNLDRERWDNTSKKIHCEECQHVFHGETKDPWKVYELKKDAKDLGLKVEITTPNKVTLTPQDVAEIVEERTKAIAGVEKPNPAFRSFRTPGEMLAPLIADDNIQTLTVDGENVTLKLTKEPKLHFKAFVKTYQTGEKSRIIVTEGWREGEKVQHRMPAVKKYEESLGPGER